MSAMPISLINLLAGTAAIFALACVAILAASPRLRVLLMRATFVVALAAPMAAMIAIPHVSIVHVVSAREIPKISNEVYVLDGKPVAIAMVHSTAGMLSPAAGMAVFGLWLIGALGVFGRYVASRLWLGRISKTASGAPDKMRGVFGALQTQLGVRSATLGISGRIDAPCTFGIAKPRVLLPRDFAHQEGLLPTVFAHELCHVRHRDALWLAIAAAVCALYWYNPLAWVLAKWHRRDIEIVCDAAATEAIDDPDVYVSALIHAAQTVMRRPAWASAAMSAPNLSYRIRQLIDRKAPLPAPHALAKTATVGAALVALSLLATTGLVSANDAAITPYDPASVMNYDRGGAFNPGPHVQLHPGEALLYVDAGTGVTIAGQRYGFLCNEASCQFTVPAHEDIELTAQPSQRLSWQGCAPSASGRACRINIAGRWARVRASAVD